MDALLGTKMGMTQVFDDNGHQVPVTVLAVGPCTVVQRKTGEVDGYDAVQVGYLDQKERRLPQPIRGHLKKAGVDGKRVLRELRVDAGDESQPGDSLSVSIFEDVGYVDVVGVTKGRGFQGVVKRHRMGGGRASHGGGNLRGPGAVGMCEYPARIFKGKKMPGQMGHCRVTTQNLKVVQVRVEDNALLVRGAVPGPNGGLVIVRKATKKPGKSS